MGITRPVKLTKRRQRFWKTIALSLSAIVILGIFLYNYNKSRIDDYVNDVLYDQIGPYVVDHIYFYTTYQLPSTFDKCQCVYLRFGDAAKRFKANLCPINFGMIPTGGCFNGRDEAGCKLCYRGLIIQRSTAVDIARANFPPNDIRLAQALEATACMRIDNFFPEYYSLDEAKQAIKEYKEARTIWATEEKWIQFGATNYNLALVYMRGNDYDQAIYALNEALNVSKKISCSLKLRLLDLLAHCYCAKHNYQAMQSTLKDMISIVKEHLDKETISDMGLMSLKLAERCMAYKAWDETIVVLSEESKLPTPYWDIRKSIFPMIAECYCRKQEYEKALPLYRKLIAIIKPEYGDATEAIGPIHQYAVILHKLPNHEREARQADKQTHIAWLAALPICGVPKGKEEEYFVDRYNNWRKYYCLDPQNEVLQGMLPNLRVPIESPDDSEVTQDLPQ